MKWWQERVVYQIYPRSFKDTDADGIGDLNGIISELHKLKDLGIGIIWLSPVYMSPNADYGYDISDYKTIHPDYGSMADMDRLIDLAHDLDIKIVMDLVVNHTSDKHPWFEESKNPQSPYRDYYYWRPGKNGNPPNNWTSFFAGDCWTYDETAGAYYLHLFTHNQPDLNYHNPKVLAEIEEIMKFWLDKGVDGFRCDVINIIYKTSLEDGKKKLVLPGSEHYLSQPGAHEILKRFHRNVLSKYDCFTVGETVFVIPADADLFCNPSRNELDMVFSFEHVETDQFIVRWFKRRFSPKRFAKVLFKWQTALDWNANYLENHDQPRSVSRFANDKRYWSHSSKMLATLLMTLKGTPFIYQGQEIGMTNFAFQSLNQIKDIETHKVTRFAKKLHIPDWYLWAMIRQNSRDNARTPYQWSPEPYGGFSTVEPWLLVNPNYLTINRQDQENDPGSLLNFYKKLIDLRKTSKVLLQGDFIPLKATRHIISYQRKLGNQTWTILLNFSKKTINHTLSGDRILSNYNDSPHGNTLRPYEAIIICEK